MTRITYLWVWMMALKARPSLQLVVKSFNLTESSYLTGIFRNQNSSEVKMIRDDTLPQKKKVE